MCIIMAMALIQRKVVPKLHMTKNIDKGCPAAGACTLDLRCLEARKIICRRMPVQREQSERAEGVVDNFT